MRKIIILFMTLTMILISGCSNSTGNNYVLMVKNGHPNSYPNATYGKAFESFFDSPSWRYFKSTDEKDIVEFTGGCLYENVKVKVNMQFVLNIQAGTFDVGAVSFNEVPQNKIIIAVLIRKVFEGDAAKSTDIVPDSKYLTSLLKVGVYGVKCSDFLGFTIDDLKEVVNNSSDAINKVYYNFMSISGVRKEFNLGTDKKYYIINDIYDHSSDKIFYLVAKDNKVVACGRMLAGENQYKVDDIIFGYYNIPTPEVTNNIKTDFAGAVTYTWKIQGFTLNIVGKPLVTNQTIESNLALIELATINNISETSLSNQETNQNSNVNNSNTQEINGTSNNSTLANDFIIPNSSSVIVTEKDLESLDLFKLNLAKNEIFARHGYIFKDEQLKTYFQYQKWYSQNSSFNGQLTNQIEKQNVELIKKVEEKKKSELSSNNSITAEQALNNLQTKLKLQVYSQIDLSTIKLTEIYGEPFYIFSLEYFNKDGYEGDSRYVVSKITGNIYQYSVDGSMTLLYLNK